MPNVTDETPGHATDPNGATSYPSPPSAAVADTKPLEIGQYDSGDPETWFAQAEALFRLRNISADSKKAALLIQALPKDLFKLIWPSVSASTTASYENLKGQLLDFHGISPTERARKLFSYIDAPAGDVSPSVLLKTLRHISSIPKTATRQESSLDLVMEIMLQCFPPSVRCHFPSYHSLTEEDFLRQADIIASQLRSSKLVAAPATEEDTQVAAPVQQHKRPYTKWCHYHYRFGTKARNCIKPCGFIPRPEFPPPRYIQQPPSTLHPRQVSKSLSGYREIPQTVNHLFNDEILRNNSDVLQFISDYFNCKDLNLDGDSKNSIVSGDSGRTPKHTIWNTFSCSNKEDQSSNRCACTNKGPASALPITSFHVCDDFSGKRFLIDTGACRSFIPYDRTLTNLCTYRGPNVITANGQPLKIYGTKDFNLSLKGEKYLWSFIIADVSMPILGADFLVAHNLTINLAKQQLLKANTINFPNSDIHSDVKSILNEFSDIFCEDLLDKPKGQCKHNFSHKINTNCRPIKSKFRRLDPAKLEIAKKVFDEMEEAGICQKDSSAWASPLHMVPKPDGSFRPCGDYRRLNVATEPDHYALPNMADITNVIGKGKYFSKIDMLKGYFQVPVHKDDIPKTAIITPFGNYTFNYTCFGLRNAGATFQRLMDSLFGKLPFVIVYIDDILIFSDNLKDHIKHIKQVLEILRANGLVIKPSKCSWAQKSIEFLGHSVGSNGISPLKSKVDAIDKFPIPQSVKQLQEFNGMVNFYHRFLPNIATTMAPLYEALKNKPKSLVWSPILDKAFRATKLALANATTLSYPIKNANLRLTTDASEIAMGGS